MAIEYITGIEQGTQEWLDLRRNKITCSNAYLLLTKGKVACFKANEKAYARTTPNGNIYAERGHVIEAETKEKFNNVIKQHYPQYEIRNFTFIVNDKYKDAGYSPDGIICDEKMENIMPIEVKAYNDVVVRNGEEVVVNKHLNAVNDFKKVPLQARCQMEMEMLITETYKMVLLLANPDCKDKSKRYKIYEVDSDPKVRAELERKLMS